MDMQTHLQICSVCGAENVLSHAWDDGEQTLAPTHTTTGRMLYTCTDCGLMEIQTLPLLPEHAFGEWQTVKSATCTLQGLQTRTCPCGVKQTQEILPSGHSYVSTDTPPTCTKNGYITHVCQWCGYTYKDQVYSPAGHRYTDDADVTCDACGAKRQPLNGSSSSSSSSSNASSNASSNETKNSSDATSNSADTTPAQNQPTTSESPQAQTDTSYQKAVKRGAVIGASVATGATLSVCIGGYMLFAWRKKRQAKLVKSASTRKNG